MGAKDMTERPDRDSAFYATVRENADKASRRMRELKKFEARVKAFAAVVRRHNPEWGARKRRGKPHLVLTLWWIPMWNLHVRKKINVLAIAYNLRVVDFTNIANVGDVTVMCSRFKIKIEVIFTDITPFRKEFFTDE